MREDWSSQWPDLTLLDGHLVAWLGHAQPVQQVHHALLRHEGGGEEVWPPGHVVQGGRDEDEQAEEEGAGHGHQVLDVLALVDELVEEDDADTDLQQQMGKLDTQWGVEWNLLMLITYDYVGHQDCESSNQFDYHVAAGFHLLL